jgi:hypothetical protein
VGRPGLEGVAAGADHIDFAIGGMNTGLHESSRISYYNTRTPVGPVSPRG